MTMTDSTLHTAMGTIPIPHRGHRVIRLDLKGGAEGLMVLSDDIGQPAVVCTDILPEIMTVRIDQGRKGNARVELRTKRETRVLRLRIADAGETVRLTHPLEKSTHPPTRYGLMRWNRYGLLPDDPKQPYEVDQ